MNEWHHVLGVKSGNDYYLYHDGLLLDRINTNIGNTDNAESFYIGKYSSESNYNFDGQIDQVKIWNYALTAEQVKIEHNNGAVKF